MAFLIYAFLAQMNSCIFGFVCGRGDCRVVYITSDILRTLMVLTHGCIICSRCIRFLLLVTIIGAMQALAVVELGRAFTTDDAFFVLYAGK